MGVAILYGAVNSDTVERVRRDVRPEPLLTAMQAQLRAVTAGGRVQPVQPLALELQLIGSSARLREEAPPAAQGHVVGPALGQAGLEVPRWPLAQPWKDVPHPLLLERLRAGR